MLNTNTAQLIGYVGNHLRTIWRNETKKVLIRVATHHQVQKNGAKKYITSWHCVSAWGEMAEIAEAHFVKGSRILVQGRILYRTYPDQTGHIRYVTEIVAESLINLDR